MKKHGSVLLLTAMFFVGLSVLLYPTLSNCWNSRVQSRAIQNYEQVLQELDAEACAQQFEAADLYNARLRQLSFPLLQTNRAQGYTELLDVSGSGVMGYLSIEKIGVEMPIYHGTSEPVLNIAAGHLEGSSLPVGGAGTHAVLSAHRGLPSARLFTDLDRLETGDSFTITVLNRVLTYEIDQILIVEPDETEPLRIIEGEDCCTLFTCTPYGINTHRLLVRGRRAETASARPALLVANEACRIDPMLVAPAAAAPMLLILLIVLLVKYRKKS